ncbi:malonate decarboxylase subunit epsilon [Sporosarcina sp. P16b]|uniref:ACP S-malonyltransferase n=1 Tax=Sporosarcina sp. P16b TaxID=2048261 RepID=UPI000C167CA9|nr:malonate decarboxylase subunit epsilon [Sporosarcina sp. P16b]PIC69318.1 malonate decarboxylase subunit epsilon [Sporosarcina sp. P16b]
MKSAWLFPGQGSQYPLFLDDLPQYSGVIKTINTASEILNEPIRALQTKEKLNSTKNVQMTMLTTGVAAARYLMDEGAEPQFVAGHSVGAFAAAVIANVLKFEDALSLVKERGELMEELQDENYGMAVIVGLTEVQLEKVVSTIHTKEFPVYVSNRNSPTQLTLSGHKSAMRQVIREVDGKGASSAKMLRVTTPSHSPLFLPVQKKLKERLSSLELRRPTIPIIANRNARVLRRAEDISDDLAESIALPVRWHDVTTVLHENGVRQFIEMPPGDVLKRLANQAYPDIHSYAVTTNGVDDCLYVEKNKGV